MILKVPLRLIRYIVGYLFLLLLLSAAYLRYDYDNWYLSSGDRALARMNFCGYPYSSLDLFMEISRYLFLEMFFPDESVTSYIAAPIAP
jgi:hypothetical protein